MNACLWLFHIQTAAAILMKFGTRDTFYPDIKIYAGETDYSYN